MLAQLQLSQASNGVTPETSTNTETNTKNGKDYKRLDEVYDNKIRDWKITETAERTKEEYDCVSIIILSRTGSIETRRRHGVDQRRM